MDKVRSIELGMTSAATYQIIVIGRLDEGWAEWFNGTEIALVDDQGDIPHTTLNCQVRDQSELLGVLNSLNSLNLPLLCVDFIGKEKKSDL